MHSLKTLAIVLALLSVPVAQAMSTQCDTVYAVHDDSTSDSQFFSYDLNTDSLTPIGELQLNQDIESLAVHPLNHTLYATNGSPNAQLYQVNPHNGDLTSLGNIGFHDVTGLAFHPDGSLWGGAKAGLVLIDIETGAGELISSLDATLQALTWDATGSVLYGAVETDTGSELWVYDGTEWTLACTELPPKVESLETRPDGYLLYGFHDDEQLGIHTYDAAQCQTLGDARLDTEYNDIEGLAWSLQSCVLGNLEALRQYLASLEGSEAVNIDAETGAVDWTVAGETYYAQLLDPLETGERPEALELNPVNDLNCDEIDDYQVVYPSGDRQLVEYYGTQAPTAVPVLTPTAIDPTVASLVDTTTAFLYQGANPIQTGVAADTIEPVRAGVIRGQVTGCERKPLAGVKVSILNHPEYGQTLTRRDGMFDMAVNGPADLRVVYQKTGFLTVQRPIQVIAQDYAWVDEVELIKPDAQVTQITLPSDTLQVARGSVETDSDGTRQATVLFPPNVTAAMVLPDGSEQPLTTLDVRATEYTVGDRGLARMPAQLPANTMYTYALEYTVDQALAAGAHQVKFDQPVFAYVENFLDFPTGIIVPSGYYDVQQGQWIAQPDGRIIKILAIEQGQAVLDVLGEGEAADADALAELGITATELTQVAQLYSTGSSLWRVPLNHFSPYDFNFAIIGPKDAKRPDLDPETPEEQDDPDCEQGSIIECQNQVLGETIPIVGTPFSLNYRSNRVPGYKVENTLFLPLEPHDHSSFLNTIVEIQIAGRLIRKLFSGMHPPVEYTFTWDGKDAYGRVVQGEQKARFRVGYTYRAKVIRIGAAQSVGAAISLQGLAGSFGYVPPGAGGSSSEWGGSTRPWAANTTYWTPWYSTTLGHIWDTRGQGFGSWTLNTHHSYSPIGQGLVLGNGQQLQNSIQLAGGTQVVSRSKNGTYSDGWPTSQVERGFDGSAYFLYHYYDEARRMYERTVIRRISPEGILSEIKLEVENEILNVRAAWSMAITPDNHFYIILGNKSIYKVSPDGKHITLFAGEGTSAYMPGIHVSQLELHHIPSDNGYPRKNMQNIAAGPDGSLYIHKYRAYYGTSGTEALYRVTPEGFVYQVSTSDAPLYIPLGNRSILDIEVDLNGRIYVIFLERNFNRRILTYLDPGASTWQTLEFPEVDIRRVYTSLATDFENNLYLRAKGIIYRYNHNEAKTLEVVAGNDIDSGSHYTDGMAATAFALGMGENSSEFVVNHHGHMYIALGGLTGNKFQDFRNSYPIIRVGPVMPGVQANNFYVAAQDGSVAYQFNREGKHLSTIDTLNAQTLYQFDYGTHGYLTQITDVDGDITRIERDSTGQLQAIVAPDGQRTTFSLDDAGFLSTFTNAANESYLIDYTEDGLLTEFTNPRQHRSLKRYDKWGRLTYSEDAAGGAWTLTRTEDKENSTATVAMTTSMEKTTQYITKNLHHRVQNTQVHPDGTQQFTEVVNNGSIKNISTDGTTITQTLMPDPRFGMNAAYPAEITIETPSGLKGVAKIEQTAEIPDAESLFTPDSVTTTITYNDKRTSSQTHYDRNAQTVTHTSAAGRQNVANLDAKGRLIRDHVPGIADIHYRYDTRGRLIEIRQGEGTTARIDTISYDAQGYVATLTDAANRSESYTYDAVGRVLTQKLPDNREINYEYDKNGNLIALKPPARPEHTYTYDARDQQTSYEAPDVGLTTHETLSSYNLDEQLTRITRPDNKIIDFNYDEAGRLTELVLPKGQQTFNYDNSTGQLNQVVDQSSRSTLDYTYDGKLLTSEQWSGVTSGRVNYRYNNDFRIAGTQVNQLAEIAYQYDDDGLLIQAGDLLLTRDPDNGLLTGTQLGDITTTLEYNDFGELRREVAQYQDTVLYEANYARDTLGRLTAKAETIAGVTTIAEYQYDLSGRLTRVTVDGVQTTYGYDGNSNRTHVNGSAIANYDAQDRMLSYADATYTYTPNGELQQKNLNGQTTEYRYDTGSNLQQVTAGGQTIRYIIDGNDRRIGKTVNGTLQRTWVYQGSTNPAASFAADGQLLGQYIYATLDNMPDYVLADGVLYRYITDHLGSVRLLVDVATGAIVQRSDYDAWGEMQRDVELAFQPFGFAGGVYDADTGLVRFGARDYDAEVGRWTLQDPIGHASQAVNLYAYVYNDPINHLDSSGLFVPYLVGCFLRGAGMSAATQLLWEGRGVECLDWEEILWGGLENCNPFSFLRKLGIKSAAERAREIHKAVPEATQSRTTIAVTETTEGVRIISSSEKKLRKAQRELLEKGELEGTGVGHAEVTGVNAAKAAGYTPTGTAASRPICHNCQDFLKTEGVKPLSPLKK